MKFINSLEKRERERQIERKKKKNRKRGGGNVFIASKGDL